MPETHPPSRRYFRNAYLLTKTKEIRDPHDAACRDPPSRRVHGDPCIQSLENRVATDNIEARFFKLGLRSSHLGPGRQEIVEYYHRQMRSTVDLQRVEVVIDPTGTLSQMSFANGRIPPQQVETNRAIVHHPHERASDAQCPEHITLPITPLPFGMGTTATGYGWSAAIFAANLRFISC